MKRISLCADDFGMHPAISEAIVRLAQNQRLNATSCLVTSNFWSSDFALLRPLKEHIDIGLHLNFTEGKGLSDHFKKGLPGLSNMLWKSHCRLFSSEQIEDEIRAQLEQFMFVSGLRPDFIDGHQHIHHLPQIRNALLKVLAEKELDTLWIRSVTPLIMNTSSLKSRMIEGSGARAFRHMIQSTPLKTNPAFAGVYSLSENENFSQLMPFWLESLPDKGLIMCHPCIPSDKSSINKDIDHQKARQLEFNYLDSQQFIDTLHKTKTSLYQLSTL